nr:retrovirus-related Pol polyprotein from transposon TNT 1-94 [Tanacetum cinerariifolium]
MHWEAVKCILRYLKGTSNIGLSFEKGRASPNGVVGYVDSDYTGGHDARKSLSSYIFFHCGYASSWYSSLQAITALSTTEAEYISSTEGVKEAMWLRRMVNEFGLPQKVLVVYCDNLSTVHLTKNNKFHSKTKHIEGRHHFVRDIVEKGEVIVDKIHTNDNPADMLTKVLTPTKGPSDTPVYLCTCEQCGHVLIHETCLKCNSGTRNSFTYDTIPESFDEVQIIPNPPPQCHFNIYLCQICESNSHYGYECSQRVPLVYEPEPCYIQNLSENDYSHDLPSVNSLIDHYCCYKYGNSLNDFFCHQCTCEFCGNGAHVGYNCPAQVPSFQTLPSFPQQYHFYEDYQAANAQYWKIPACCDDDDDYNFAITPNEPVDSPSMGDEHLNTIPATESNEFIKSSVENLVPDPRRIIPMKIDQHHDNAESALIESLLNHDSSLIISSKIDSLLDEFADELTLLKLIPPGIDETDCDPEEDIRLTKRLLYDYSSPRPPEEFVSKNSNAEIKSFSPSPIPVEDSDPLMEEIDLSFTSDYPMPPSIEDDDYDSERNILILEELLDNYSLSLPENESFRFDIPSFSRPPAKPPDGDTGILNVKMMGDISDQKVSMPKLMITLASNQEKSPNLLSHQGLKAFQPSAKCPMMIHGKNTPILDVPLFHFYPP